MSTPLWAIKGMNYTFKGASKVKNVLNMSVSPLYDEIICPNNKNCYKNS